mmetsp:Transcript_14367/g.26422  ORF Transcript_14367/g.26422 Transcript_14367/m.26422 type:complete len:259 (+) Transcript_14367:59-835(+)
MDRPGVSRRKYIKGRDDMGVLPNTKDALAVLDRKDIQRFLYSTTHRSDFQGRSLAPHERGSSFLDVQEVGIRDTPFMKRPTSKVGLMRREDVGYAKEYTVKPLDQVGIDHELAATFRPQRGVTAEHMTTGTTTTYAEDFVRLFDTSRFESFKPEHPCKAKKIIDVTASTKSLPSRVDMVRTAPTHRAQGRSDEGIHPPLNLYVEPACTNSADTFRSTYRDDFDAKPSMREWRRRHRTLNGLHEFRQTAPHFGSKAKVV